jgi:hypothetical protein
MSNLVARDVSSWKVFEKNIAYLDKQNNLYLLSMGHLGGKVASNVKEFQLAKGILTYVTNNGELLVINFPENA